LKTEFVEIDVERLDGPDLGINVVPNPKTVSCDLISAFYEGFVL
jgi:hypothetical protein